MNNRTMTQSEVEEEIVLQTEQAMTHGIAIKGDPSEWRDSVGMFSSGNSRLIFAISVSFSAPLLYILNEESGGFHYRGPSSIGKTTALSAAASVYGSPEFIKNWRATANGIEATAAAHNDLVLLLDEINQADPAQVGEVIYMIANQQGKQRANRTGGGRHRAKWRLQLLSSGEKSLADHIAGAGRKSTAGQEVRLVDISADTLQHGIFETLHGFLDGGALSRAIKEACKQNYGTAGRSFVEHLCNNLTELPGKFALFQNEFLHDHVPNGSSGQVRRVAQRFALAAFAGELATVHGITGWKDGEATGAAAKLFKEWLASRSGVGEYEATALLAQVRYFFEQHGDSRFTAWNNDGATKTINRAGFRKKESEAAEEEEAAAAYEYYVLPETFKEIVKGFDRGLAIQVLKESGLLVLGTDKAATTIKPPGHGSMRAYRFSSKVLG